MSTAKNYQLVSFLSVVSKVFEKLVNNRIVGHLEKFALFLVFGMFLGLLNQLQIFFTFVPDRIARAFNRSGATRAVLELVLHSWSYTFCIIY